MVFKNLNKEPPGIVGEGAGTILAKGVDLTLNTWESNLNNNVMLVGASGRGKTRYFIKPNIMQMNSNYVISDPKGTILQEVGAMLENNGYHIKVLNLIDMEHSQGYNPFEYIRNDSDVYKIINYIMENVNPANARYSDPFWPNASKSLLSAVMFYLYKECLPSERNFTNVMRLLRAAIVREDDDYKSPLDIIFGDLAEKDPNHIAVMQYSIFKQAPAKTASCILTCAEVDLQCFNLEEYANLTATDTLDLYSLSTEKTALFVITSDTDKSKNWLAGLFYSQLFDILCRTQNQHHIRFILDDFVCTGRIPDFDYKIAMIRSRNISCIVVIQDEAQLYIEYGKAARGIISNCDSYVFLGSSNIDACNDVAYRLCQHGVTGPSIRKLPYDKCVVVYGNQGGVYKKYDIKTHPNYHLISDDINSPNFYDVPRKVGSLKDIVKRHQQLQRSYALSKRLAATNSKEVKNHISKSSIKGTMFDSPEEAVFYDALKAVPDAVVCPHQHLRDIFVSDETSLSKKMGYMHCDFIFRDLNMNILFGVEIDGKQHHTDPKQVENDDIKDELFKQHGIPLLRFHSSEIRKNMNVVAATVKLFMQKDAFINEEFSLLDDNE